MLEEWCWNGGGSPTDLGTRGLTLTAANGDELWGTHSFFAFTSFYTFEEVLDFNGGTGRFKYATGQFNESVSIIYGDESLTFGTFTMTGEGTITY